MKVEKVEKIVKTRVATGRATICGAPDSVASATLAKRDLAERRKNRERDLASATLGIHKIPPVLV